MTDEDGLHIKFLGVKYPVTPLDNIPETTGQVYAMKISGTQKKAIEDLEDKLRRNFRLIKTFPENIQIIVYPVRTAFEIVITDSYVESKESLKIKYLRAWLRKKGKNARKILREELGLSPEQLSDITNYEEELLRKLEDKETRKYLGYAPPRIATE